MSKIFFSLVVLPVLVLVTTLSVSAEEIVRDTPSVAPNLGQEANIITASIREQSSMKGDNMTVDVRWVPINEYQVSSIGDEHPAPLSVNLSITDEAGSFCADPVWKTVFLEHQSFSISAVATRNCNRLYARIALIDANMKLLDAVDITTDEKVFAESQAPAIEKPSSNSPSFFEKASSVITIFTIIGGIVILLLVAIFLNRRSHSHHTAAMLFLPLIFAMSFFVSINQVNAETFDIRPGANPAYPLMGTATMYTDKTTYAPGESITVHGSFSVNFQVGLACPWNMTVKMNTEPIMFLPNPYRILTTTAWSGSAQRTLTAPTVPGNYTINTYVTGGCYAGYGGSVVLPITVGPTAVPGVCGTANGASFSTAPTSNLCVSGTTSWTDSTATDNTFDWNCLGSNGGVNTSCVANKTTATPTAACGTANGGTFPSAPTANLCAIGNPSAVYDYGYWSWSCAPTLCYTVLTMYSGYVTMCMISGPYTVPVSCAADKAAAATPPSVAFWAESTDILAGESTTLHWTSTGATSCTASGAWSGTRATSSTEGTGGLTSDETYYLSCTGPGGTSPTYTVDVGVTALPPTPACTGTAPTNANACSTDEPTAPENYQIVANCGTSPSKCLYTCNSGFYADGTGSSCIATACNNGIDNDGDGKVDAADPGCSGPNDNDETDTPPTVTASPRTVTEGSQTTISWDTNNGNEPLCTLSGGAIVGNPLATDGGDETGSVNVPVSARTTYTVTCPTGAASITVDIIPTGFET